MSNIIQEILEEIDNKYNNEYDCDCDQDGFFQISRTKYDILEQDYPNLSDELYYKIEKEIEKEQQIKYDEELRKSNIGREL